MARHISLPRLTRRQRMAKWQRERRQQLVYLSIFSVFLFFALGLLGWAAAGRYYDDNLKPAARVDGRAIPVRDFNKRFAYDRERLLGELPPGAANDPSYRSFLAGLRKSALDNVVQREVLLAIAAEERRAPTGAELRARLDRDFGEARTRHILVKVDDKATDKERADTDAKAKATQLAAQLRADPSNAGLWQELAATDSGDTGTKDKGGDLGWVGASSGFVKEFEDAMLSLADGAVSDPVKTTFGYHVIQRIESRPYNRTPLFARLRRLGLSEDDLTAIARGSLLRDRYERERRDAEIASPQEQLRLGIIVVHLPSPNDLQNYTAAIRKINQVVEGFEKGADFAQMVKDHSDDAETKDKKGDLGWVTRSMLPNKRIADNVFSLEAGQRSDQHQLPGGDIAIYKVLEKDPERAVGEEQKSKIREQAFTLWLTDQESRLSVIRLIPGLEF